MWNVLQHSIVLGLLCLGLSAAARTTVSAQELSAEQQELFEKHIRPLLWDHCIECHGPQKQEGGLNLASRESLVQGGDSGTALVPGKPAESLLMQAVGYLDEPKMPPSGKLPEDKIALLHRWVEAGAVWPDASGQDPGGAAASGFQVTEKQKTWWAFQPLRNVSPPEVRRTDWPRGGLDRFVLARLESAGLAPAAAAGRVEWLRRATFDLTGLPPKPEEIEAFVADRSEHAFEAVIDRLLDSPAYGQRWARHWLDVARYADYYDANPATRVASCEITEAWRYRDWVVDAFNRDLPFDRFIVHQIAGDQLPDPMGGEIYPQGLIATTFLSNGVWDRGDADKEKIVSDMVDDNIGVIGKAFLGLTLDCARCHDHKFDPISTADYYALAGMFYSSHILKELGAKGGEYTVNRVPLIGPAELAERTALQQQLDEVVARLESLDRRHRMEQLLAGGQPLEVTDFHSDAGATASIAEDGSVTVGGNLAQDRYVIEALGPAEIDVRYLRLEVLSDVSLPHGGPGRASDGNFVVSRFSGSYTAPGSTGQPIPIQFVSAQADFEQAGFPVQSVLDDDLKDGWAIAPLVGQPHVAVLEISPQHTIPRGSRVSLVIEHRYADSHTLGKLRLSMLDELSTSAPPDTAERRELVAGRERLEQLLAVPVPVAMAVTDGGTAGGLFPGIQDVPIHIRGSYARLGPIVPRGLPRFFVGDDQPKITRGSGRRELADWVASRDNPLTARVIVNRVWHWHFGAGLVRTPSNFGLLSEPPTHPDLLDWLTTRFIEDGWSLKKLHRRILLSATYRQSCRVAPEIFEKDPENRWLGRFSARRLEAEAIRDAILAVSGQLDLTPGGPAGDDFSIRRRSLYVQTARWQRDSYATLFDAANPDASTEGRVTSTVAPQALLLLNHPWMQDQARRLAERLMREVPADDAARIRRAYVLLFGRDPSEAELGIARQLIADGEASDPVRGWTDLAHVLLCSNEFVYLD